MLTPEDFVEIGSRVGVALAERDDADGPRPFLLVAFDHGGVAVDIVGNVPHGAIAGALWHALTTHIRGRDEVAPWSVDDMRDVVRAADAAPAQAADAIDKARG